MPPSSSTGFVRRMTAGNRTIASRLTPHLARTPLKPNQVATLSLAAGFLGAACLSGGERPALLAGTAFLQLSFILRHCDGDVARLNGGRSEFGRWHGLTSYLFVEFAVWAGLALGAVEQGEPRAIYWLAGAACLGSFLNFMRVAAADSASETPEGDPTLALWILALIGNSAVFLLAGCLYAYARSLRPLFRR